MISDTKQKSRRRILKYSLWLLLVIALAFVVNIPQTIYFVVNGRTSEADGDKAKIYLQEYVGTIAATMVNDVVLVDKLYFPGARFKWFTFKCDAVVFQAISQKLSSDSEYIIYDSGVITITPKDGGYNYVLNEDEGVYHGDRDRGPEWWPSPEILSGLQTIHVRRDVRGEWSDFWYYYDNKRHVCWLVMKV